MRTPPFTPVVFNSVMVALLIGFVTMVGCSTTAATKEATMFATLQGAAAGIDSFRASYEAAFAAGSITGEDKTRLDRQFNAANDAIIRAARLLDAGMSTDTPEEVDRLVRELAELVVLLVPPKPRI